MIHWYYLPFLAVLLYGAFIVKQEKRDWPFAAVFVFVGFILLIAAKVLP